MCSLVSQASVDYSTNTPHKYDPRFRGPQYTHWQCASPASLRRTSLSLSFSLCLNSFSFSLEPFFLLSLLDCFFAAAALPVTDSFFDNQMILLSACPIQLLLFTFYCVVLCAFFINCVLPSGCCVWRVSIQLDAMTITAKKHLAIPIFILTANSAFKKTRKKRAPPVLCIYVKAHIIFVCLLVETFV